MGRMNSRVLPLDAAGTSDKEAEPAVDAEGQRIKEQSTTAGLRSLHPYARNSTLAILHRFHAREVADRMERPAFERL